MFRYTFLSILLIATRVVAQAPADTTVELPEALIEADAERQLTSTRLTHLDARAIASNPNSSVADVLARTGNVYVQRYGPSGLATASFRGTGGKNTSIYLDGLPLSDPQANEIDLSIIPLIMIESIDVEHGAGTAAASAGSMGGSVFLNTVDPEAGTGRMTLEGGQYGNMRLGAAGGSAIGPIRLTAAGELSQFEGDYPYTNPTLIGAPEQTREGADKSLASGYVSAAYSTDGHRATIAGWVNSVERGLPGPGNATPVGARQWDDQIRTWISTEHSVGAWSLETSAFLNNTRLRYVNETTGSDDTTTTNSANVAVNAGRVFGTSLLLNAGLTTGSDWSPDVSEWRLAVFSEITWSLGRLYATPSVRYESRRSMDSELGAVVPRLGLAVNLDESGRILVKSNIGRSFRMPSFAERFWIPGGNPNLKAEDGWTIDAGIAGTMGDRATTGSGSTDFEATVFFTRMDDQISWFPSFVGEGLQIWTPYNVGLTYTYGLEYSLSTVRQMGRAAIRAGVSGMLNRAIDKSDENAASYGNQLRYVPEVTGSLIAGLDLDPFSLDLTGRYVGPRYVTSDESMTIASYFVVDAKASYTVGIDESELRLSALAENLFDAQYAVIRFYPMPPRLIMLRAEIRIN